MHTTYLVRPDDKNDDFYQAVVIHNGDWSGDARIRWWETPTSSFYEATLPGALLCALVATTHADVIDDLRQVLDRLVGPRLTHSERLSIREL